MSVRLTGLVAALALLAAASEAKSRTIFVTYDGVISSGSDTNAANASDTDGFFGLPGGNLEGARYKLVFSIDLTGTEVTNYDDGLTRFQRYDGGGLLDPPLPELLSAALTINGHTDNNFCCGIDNVAHTIVSENFPTDISYTQQFDDVNAGQIGIVATAVARGANTIPSVMRQAFSVALDPALQSTSFNEFHDQLMDGSDFYIISGSMVPNHVTSTGLPEPTTWALTLVGLFGLGAMVRRGRRRLANATA